MCVPLVVGCQVGVFSQLYYNRRQGRDQCRLHDLRTRHFLAARKHAKNLCRSVSWVRGRDSHIITVSKAPAQRPLKYPTPASQENSLSIFIFFPSIYKTSQNASSLQVDQETFISDDRFVSLKKVKESLWTLKVTLFLFSFYFMKSSSINLIFLPDKVCIGARRGSIRVSGSQNVPMVIHITKF